MATKKIIMPLPSLGFDPSEAAVSWRILRDAGHLVQFATPDGRAGAADPLMISGDGLDAWGRIPGLRKLRLFGLMLRANADARSAYSEMLRDARFNAPLKWAELTVGDFDALVLPGGHAKDMRPYLESADLQRFVAAFFGSGKPVAAICHGVVLAARSIDPATGKSVLFGRKTTALTWTLELSAWRLSKFIRFWDRDYYRTYTEEPGEAAGFRGVEAEVTRALAQPDDFLDVAADAPDGFRKASGMFRDSFDDSRPAFIARDGSYLSARWPGDVHTFATTFAAMLAEG